MCDATQLRKKRYALQSSTQLPVCTLLCLLHLQFSDLASNWVHQRPALHTAKRRRAHTRFAATVKYLGKTRFAARILGLSRCRVASSSPAANQNWPSLAASAFSLAGRSVPTHVMDCMFDYTVGASKTKLLWRELTKHSLLSGQTHLALLLLPHPTQCSFIVLLQLGTHGCRLNFQNALILGHAHFAPHRRRDCPRLLERNECPRFVRLFLVRLLAHGDTNNFPKFLEQPEYLQLGVALDIFGWDAAHPCGAPHRRAVYIRFT